MVYKLVSVRFKLYMKTLSGWEAARCDEHQFHAKINVSTWAILELSFQKWSEHKEWEKWHFRYRSLLRLAVFYVAFEHLWVLLIIKVLNDED